MKTKPNPFLRIFLVLALLLLLVAVVGIGLFYYIFAISEPEGLSLASWPERFTNNFSFWMEHSQGEITVTEKGISRLNEYGLWMQVLDETGQEVYAYGKPENYPTRYTASELLEMKTDSLEFYEDGYTAFTSRFEASGETWSYVIGFPYRIGKYMLYYNGEHIGKLSFVANVIVLIALCALILLALGYGFWLSRRLGVITGGIKKVSLRTYEPLEERGAFKEIHGALNQMDREIRTSDKLQEDTDRTRREWIANITHDLKTPLSPVKGYAELLADNQVPEPQSVQEYGGIILKNANAIEKLINDLKLTYQLDSGTMPFSPQEVKLTRYLKELTIEIINDPAFSRRDIVFESSVPELVASVDPDLFRRAIQNLVINALIHNPEDTRVKITVDSGDADRVCIYICDNGIGIGEAEQARLFTRHYRAADTGQRPEGSGLGLAIAKQIVTLHGGNITVTSKPNEGTAFTVSIPMGLRPN